MSKQEEIRHTMEKGLFRDYLQTMYCNFGTQETSIIWWQQIILRTWNDDNVTAQLGDGQILEICIELAPLMERQTSSRRVPHTIVN